MSKKDYSSWSKEEMIRELKKLEKRKKYGIVWEDKPEQVAELCKEKLPILAEDKSKYIETDKDKPVNILIEGDNYHALSVLNYTHKGEIDVIYIDPPYNTGNKSWKYNNDYVEKDDNFRHSKWLSFMEKRLKLAKNLLKRTGILLVAIDDYEHHTLRLLIDEVFGEENHLGTIVVVHNPGGRSDDQFIATAHEYLLVYGKNRSFSKINLLPLTTKQLEEYSVADDISPYKLQSFMRTGSNSREEDRPNLCYSLFYNEKEKKLSTKKDSKDYIEIIPLDSRGNKRVWRWGKETVEKNKNTEFIITKSKDKFIVKVKKRYFGENSSGSKPKTFWFDSKYNASTHGTILLQNIFRQEKTFSYPKSLYAVKDAIIISAQKNSVILDFFAGSGTTGHAILELNKEDDGKRKFILCTNNEDNNNDGTKICSDICYPRIQRVIKGYKNLKDEKIEGLNGNLKYYKTDFVDANPTDINKKKLVDKSTEMLCLKEDCFDEIKKGHEFKVFKNSYDKHLAIIYDDEGIDDFKKEAKRLKKKFVVYIFSLDESAREEEFEDISDLIELKPIPAVILNVYKRIFK
jgi:adenine-specific DNA-methyltransferase